MIERKRNIAFPSKAQKLSSFNGVLWFLLIRNLVFLIYSSGLSGNNVPLTNDQSALWNTSRLAGGIHKPC